MRRAAPSGYSEAVAAFGSRQMQGALSALASASEPPAAGAACALTCAAASALVELTAGLAAKRYRAGGDADRPETAERMSALAERTQELRGVLLAAVDEDAAAYAKVVKAPHGVARAEALARASEPPLAIAEVSAEIAEAAAETAAQIGKWDFRADAIVASRLAAAAALNAAELVVVDLGGDTEDSRSVRAQDAVDRAKRASSAASDSTST